MCIHVIHLLGTRSMCLCFFSALTEKIVAVLPRMKCPHRLEPHQIQGLDFIHIYPVIQVSSSHVTHLYCPVNSSLLPSLLFHYLLSLPPSLHQWLVKLAIATREEMGDYIRAFSESQFSKDHKTPEVCGSFSFSQMAAVSFTVLFSCTGCGIHVTQRAGGGLD